MIASKSFISKLADEIDLITSANPSHRVNIQDRRDIAPLVKAVNKLADRYEELCSGVQQKIQRANAAAEEEKNILAAFISELPEGVLICNAEGQILLFNRRAREFLVIEDNKSSDAATESGQFYGLGRSISSVIDKTLIEHALDEINARLKRQVVNAESHFVIEGQGKHILRSQVVPIINRLGQFTGFILILKDITQQREADNRVDSLLQALTKSARSPLASIRAAIETMLEYHDMDRIQAQQFKEIIYKESITLSTILNQVAGDYASFVKTQRSLKPIAGADLIESVRSGARDRLGILVNVAKPVEKIQVKADSYSIITAILFVLNQLKNETDLWEYTFKLNRDAKFANLDLIWQGNPIRTETLQKWEKQFLVIEKQKSPLTLIEVLRHHEAALWSYACTDAENCAYIRLLLPVEESSEPEKRKPITVLPESQAGFYNFDLLSQPGRNPELDNRLLTELTYTVLVREIAAATDIEEIIRKHSQLPGLIYNMITSGAKIRNVTWLITTFSDAILDKLIGFALEELGQPPAPFTFITLGSEGRKEQTLKTDQDNAIIFQDVSPGTGESEKDIKEYFLAFGKKVCTWLDQIGYDFCTGGVMAQNPKWCQPLSAWKKYFSSWIHAAKPEDLLHSAIFFDFRFAYGDQAIFDNLSKYLSDSLSGWTGFFRYLTENAVYFKPPIGFFGNFLVKTEGRQRNCLDIKSAITPIVDFSRIYALKNNIKATNTQERLYQLYLKKILSLKEYNEIEQAYSFMMQVRFVQQIKATVDIGVKPDNYIKPKKLSAIEQKMLKAIFKKVESIQTQLSFEFTGSSDAHIK